MYNLIIQCGHADQKRKGGHYAAFTFTKKGETRNIVSTGTLEMRVTSMNTLSLTDAVPTRDIDGQSSDPYTFVINNIGTASSSYQLKIVEDTKEYEKGLQLYSKGVLIKNLDRPRSRNGSCKPTFSSKAYY